MELDTRPSAVIKQVGKHTYQIWIIDQYGRIDRATQREVLGHDRAYRKAQRMLEAYTKRQPYTCEQIRLTRKRTSEIGKSS